MRWLLLGALVAISLVACGVGDETAERGRLTFDERAWVRELVAWMASVEQGAGDGEELRFEALGGGPEARQRFDTAVAPVLGCAERFRDRPGEAPSKRLGKVAELALEACEQFARAIRAELRAFDGNPGEQLAIVDAANAEGTRLLLEADRELELLATWNRPLPVRGGDRRTSRIEPRFGRIASRFANRRIEVRCWSRQDWREVFGDWQAFANDRDLVTGFVASFDRGQLSLDPDTCNGLVRLAYHQDVPEGEDAWEVAGAVGTLTHEVEHLVSPASEAVTECRGMQAIREYARALGATKREAAMLAEVYWDELYPENPAEYRTRQCRDGGPLDLDPASAAWP